MQKFFYKNQSFSLSFFQFFLALEFKKFNKTVKHRRLRIEIQKFLGDSNIFAKVCLYCPGFG